MNSMEITAHITKDVKRGMKKFVSCFNLDILNLQEHIYSTKIEFELCISILERSDKLCLMVAQKDALGSKK